MAFVEGAIAFVGGAVTFVEGAVTFVGEGAVTFVGEGSSAVGGGSFKTAGVRVVDDVEGVNKRDLRRWLITYELKDPSLLMYS